eukprot:TRINITY_DN39476_c0_g1_i2.p1 TRINITY_DN39476_c0_g1~~TRINITY_DN39476_c0_g1_i2.p1  ORF type:complete len:501 (-),score=72.65 TRINITY_DN39476_c0_g1_i2:157-1659(-)
MAGCLSREAAAGIGTSLLFVTLNVAMNIYMKWLFSPFGGDFALPWTMLAVQQLQTYFGCCRCGQQPAEEAQLTKDSLLSVMAVTGLFCLNVGLNSLSLVRITITLNQTVRAFMPVGVLLLGTLIEGRRYPWHSYLTTTLLVGGIALTCWGSPDFELRGFLLAFVSTWVAALGSSLNGRLLSVGPFSKGGPETILRLIMLQSVPAFFIFTVVASFTEGKEVSALFRWHGHGAATAGVGGSITGPWLSKLGLVTISSFLALLSNLGRCGLVASTSALMETLAGNAKVAVLCVLDSSIFGTALAVQNVFGVVLTFLGFSAHVLLQYSDSTAITGDTTRERVLSMDSTAEFLATIPEDSDSPSLFGSPPSLTRMSHSELKSFGRPRLNSAGDTGLVAEHLALSLGRGVSRQELAVLDYTQAAKPRSYSWHSGGNIGDLESRIWDFDEVLEMPDWLREDRLKPSSSSSSTSSLRSSGSSGSKESTYSFVTLKSAVSRGRCHSTPS